MRRDFAVWAIGAALLVSACATLPTSTGAGGAPPSAIPSTPLNLGEWRRASAPLVAQHFEREVSGRYAQGQQLNAVSGDLRRNEFTCSANRDTSGRGDPPDQICRKTATIESCTHTWQVHLYEASGGGALARSRALYDRRCGGDGLLGGPS